MYLFFDTETTGKPKNYNGDIRDLDNWPRVIQLAYAFFDAEEQLVFSGKDLIKPDGWTIPEEEFWIKHGYSTAQSELEGVPFMQAVEPFVSALNMSQYLVSHNMSFDHPVLAAEMIRYGVKSYRRPIKICTMRSTTPWCQLPGKYGYKFPTLIELHQKLFAEGFDGAHDALADVMACSRCFFEIKKRGIIALPEVVA